ncbi:hypothetical protein MBANPS3_011824, partial [Mucor bainieri]
MKEVALSLEHEHPVDSLIFDVTDHCCCWDDVFECAELDEIRSYRSTTLPVFSVEVESYLEQLQVSSVPAD